MIALTDDPEELALVGADPAASPQISGGIEEDALLAGASSTGTQLHALNDRFGALYTNPAAFEKFGMDPAIQNAQKWQLDPELVKYGVLNRQFLGAVTGRELTGLDFEKARNDYAKTRWGLEEINDKDFYKRAQQDFNAYDQAQTAAIDLQRDAIKETLSAGLEGRPRDLTTVFNNWRATRQDIVPDAAEGQFFNGAMQTANETIAGIGKYAPQAGQVWQMMESMRAGTINEEQIVAFGKELGKIPAEDRKRIYNYAAVAASDLSDDQRAGFAQILENGARYFGRTISQYGEAFALAPTLQNRELALRAEITRLESGAALPKKGQAAKAYGMPELEGPLPAEERAIRIAAAKEELGGLQVLRELKDTFDNKVNPIRPVYAPGGLFSAGTLEQGFYGLAGSVPYMAVASVPFVGLALNYVSIQDSEYNKLMLENPEMDHSVASAIAILSAAPQAAIEKMQFEAMAGRLPLTAELFQTMNNKVGRVLAKATAGVAAQNLEEALQDGISDFLPVLFSNLRADMPDKNPEQVFDAWLDQRAAVFWSMLLPGMMGGGFAAAEDFKDLNSVFSTRALHYTGFSEAQTQTIRSAFDPAEAHREAFAHRTPENIAKGIASLEADIEQASAAQRDPLAPTMEVVTLADGNKEYRILRSVPEEIQTEFLPDQELEGQQVTLQFTDAATGQRTSAVFDAVEAQDRVKQNLDTYKRLIDCLGQ